MPSGSFELPTKHHLAKDLARKRQSLEDNSVARSCSGALKLSCNGGKMPFGSFEMPEKPYLARDVARKREGMDARAARIAARGADSCTGALEACEAFEACKAFMQGRKDATRQLRHATETPGGKQETRKAAAEPLKHLRQTSPSCRGGMMLSGSVDYVSQEIETCFGETDGQKKGKSRSWARQRGKSNRNTIWQAAAEPVRHLPVPCKGVRWQLQWSFWSM